MVYTIVYHFFVKIGYRGQQIIPEHMMMVLQRDHHHVFRDYLLSTITNFHEKMIYNSVNHWCRLYTSLPP
jgi:hypothetical protein